MERRYFGTDGVRGVAGEFPLTAEFVLRLGQAAGAYFRRLTPKPTVLLGKDTRESGDFLEAALAAGLLSQGVRVEHLGILPTPGVAYLTRALEATAGVVISASHNPYQDNGIKFFGPGGEKFPDEAEAEIEANLEGSLPKASLGVVSDFREAERLYLEFLRAQGTSLEGLKIAIDCANGATFHLAPKLFQSLGAEVFALYVSPDGKNINKGCGSTHPETLQRIVREGGFDLGIAFDGDGDRALFVDRQGRIVHGDHILYRHALERKEPGVVGTLMSNMALELRLNEAGIEFVRAPVGDRYVLEALKARGLRLGGEPSGHVIFLDRSTTGDGMLTALLSLSLLRQTGEDLTSWYEALPMYPQLLKSIPVSDKAKLVEHPLLQEGIREAERRLAGQGRINVRPSGTEPLVRVMVEGPAELAEAISAELTALIQKLQ